MVSTVPPSAPQRPAGAGPSRGRLRRLTCAAATLAVTLFPIAGGTAAVAAEDQATEAPATDVAAQPSSQAVRAPAVYPEFRRS